MQPHLPSQLGVAFQPLPTSTSQVSQPYGAGPGNAVTSLTAELQRTCPLRDPGGVQELLSGCLTQSCCPSFGVPRPQSVSPEPRFPVGRDVLYCSYTGKTQLVGAAGHHHLGRHSILSYLPGAGETQMGFSQLMP